MSAPVLLDLANASEEKNDLIRDENAIIFGDD